MRQQFEQLALTHLYSGFGTTTKKGTNTKCHIAQQQQQQKNKTLQNSPIFSLF